MIDVVMPQMGESITEGTLTKWLKKPGDQVEQDEPLFEISTDKVDTEIPAPAAGVLKETLAEEGDTVEINTVVAKIDDGGDGGGEESEEEEPSEKEEKEKKEEKQESEEKEEEEEEKKAKEKKSKEKQKAKERDKEEDEDEEDEEDEEEEPEEKPKKDESAKVKGPVSPLVKRMAREHDLDLTKIKGTGASGRITKQDVEAYLESRDTSPKEKPTEEEAPAAEREEQVQPVSAPGAAKKRVEPMSTMRRKIAEHMVYSKRTSAHVTTVHRADMTKIAKIRSGLKAQFKERYGFSLTYLPFVARAASQVLREFPIVNASIDDTDIVYHNEINIGIAVALENGLIVPVIRNTDSLSIVGIQRAVVDLAGRARSRQLKPEEVAGGTFSITNFGSFGSLFATPVISQPNVAILGVGAVTKEPVVTEDDAIAIRSVCYLTLTFDHRLIDGALADQFTARVKEILEGWSEPVL